MVSERERLEERLLTFSAGIIKLVEQLPASLASRHIAGQMLRSGTSGYANYSEACAAESRADFIHKMQIALKELRETRSWIRLLLHAEVCALPECRLLLQEAEELCNIIGRSVVTAKKHGGNSGSYNA